MKKVVISRNLFHIIACMATELVPVLGTESFVVVK